MFIKKMLVHEVSLRPEVSVIIISIVTMIYEHLSNVVIAMMRDGNDLGCHHPLSPHDSSREKIKHV
jgi:hypothetical protein